jgi:PIN domain nuclease of toxin-antitoxin system
VTNSGLLLDTHAVYWIANKEPISKEAVESLKEANDEGWPVLVSPITAWEMGQLVARNRISLAISPLDWFNQTLEFGGIDLAAMPPSILIASSFLPGDPPKDPADRIIAATAREGGHRLVTRDRALLSYAGAGHLRAVRC